jgi:hypothetical protein
MDLPFADWHQEAKLGEIVAKKIASQTKEIWAARQVTLLSSSQPASERARWPERYQTRHTQSKCRRQRHQLQTTTAAPPQDCSARHASKKNIRVWITSQNVLLGHFGHKKKHCIKNKRTPSSLTTPILIVERLSHPLNIFSVDLVTNCLSMTEHLFISSSYVHFILTDFKCPGSLTSQALEIIFEVQRKRSDKKNNSKKK